MAHCKFATAAADIPKRATGADTAYSRTYCTSGYGRREAKRGLQRGLCAFLGSVRGKNPGEGTAAPGLS